MPHTATPAMTSLSIERTVYLVKCWDFVLRYGRGTLRFTQHNRPLVVDGNTYAPSTSVSSFASTNEIDLQASNSAVRGSISSSAISEKMLRERALVGADVTEFMVDWRFPFAGKARVVRYAIGRTKWNDRFGVFESELVSVLERMENRVGVICGPTCRNQLGDERCGVVLDPTWTRAAAVASVIDAATFETGSISGGAVDEDFFVDGKITWSAGDNVDLSSAIKSFSLSDKRFELFEPPPSPIQVGDTIIAVTGCNRLSGVTVDGLPDPSGHCKYKFGNLPRFNGEPTMPTNDRLYTTPNAKRS